MSLAGQTSPRLALVLAGSSTPCSPVLPLIAAGFDGPQMLDTTGGVVPEVPVEENVKLSTANPKPELAAFESMTALTISAESLWKPKNSGEEDTVMVCVKEGPETKLMVRSKLGAIWGPYVSKPNAATGPAKVTVSGRLGAPNFRE